MNADNIHNADTGRSNFFGKAGHGWHVITMAAEHFRYPHSIESPPVGFLYQFPGQVIRIFVGETVELKGNGVRHVLVELAGNGYNLPGFLHHMFRHVGSIGQAQPCIFKFRKT